MGFKRRSRFNFPGGHGASEASGAPSAHATTHEVGGGDELTGADIACAGSPINYTQTANTMGGHHAGIDSALGGLAAADITDVSLNHGRLSVAPCHMQTGSAETHALDGTNKGISQEFTPDVDFEYSSLSLHVSVVGGGTDRASFVLEDVTNGTTTTLKADVDCTAGWNAVTSLTNTPICQRGNTYRTRVNWSSGSVTVTGRRPNTVAGSMPQFGVTSWTTTDGWSSDSQFTQDSQPAVLNLIVNPADPAGDGSAPVPQLLFGRYNGKDIYLPTGLIEIPEEGVYLDCSALSAVGVGDTPYCVYAYDSSGTLTLEASTTKPALSGGQLVKSGDTDKRYLGINGPMNLISTYQGPVATEDVVSFQNLANKIEVICQKRPFAAQTEFQTSSATWKAWNDNEDCVLHVMSLGPVDIACNVQLFNLFTGSSSCSVGIDTIEPVSMIQLGIFYYSNTVHSFQFKIRVSHGMHKIIPLHTTQAASETYKARYFQSGAPAGQTSWMLFRWGY